MCPVIVAVARIRLKFTTMESLATSSQHVVYTGAIPMLYLMIPGTIELSAAACSSRLTWTGHSAGAVVAVEVAAAAVRTEAVVVPLLSPRLGSGS